VSPAPLHRLVPVVAVAVVLALFSGPVLAQEAFNPEGKVVREIIFQGSVRSPETFLREIIRTKIGDRYKRETIDDDLKTLFKTGRFDPDMAVDARPIQGDPDGVRLVFDLRERERVTAVRYEGMDTLKPKDAKQGADELQVKPGALYDPYKVLLDRQLILRVLRGRGLYFAEVDEERNPTEGGVEVVFVVREGPTVRVRDIEFIGNAHLSESDLERIMKTKETLLLFVRSGYLDREALDDDLETLETFYRSHGYLDARVMLDDLIFTLDRERVTVRIRVIEGERYRIRSILVRGTKLYTPEEIEAKFELKENEPFDGFKLRKDLRTLAKLYYDRGHIYADVKYTPKLVGPERQVDLAFDVIEGPQITIERIDIVNNVKTRDDVVRRELELYPGEIFDAEKMDRSRERLGRRGLFKDIQIGFEPGTAEDRRDMVIRVEEGDTGQILFGGGISTSIGLFGRIVYIERNFDIFDFPTSFEDLKRGPFRGGGQTLILQAEPGGERSRYRVTFIEPYFLPDLFKSYPIQLKTSFTYFDSVSARTYNEQQLEATVGLGYRFTRDALLELEYRIADITIFDIDPFAPTDVIEVAGDNLVSSMRLAFTFDQNVIDASFTPYRGFGVNASIEVAGTIFGGDHDFVRAEAGGNWQTTVLEFPGTSKHVFGVRASAGVITDIGASRDTPIFERFYAGGPRTVRGFEFRSVGPQEDDEPIGGELRMIGSVEYGFPIIPGLDETYAPDFRADFLRGVIFCDFGVVSREPDEIDLDEDFRLAVGVGLRIKVPLFPAPVALDFGFPLILNDDDDEEVFSFTVGAGL